MTDAKFFQNTKKGEIPELKEELQSQDKNVKKDAVKKVIAAMTVGKDVSMLFPDVVNCMQTPNIELKKLVYLYLINYAKSQPDLAIMAVNTFVMDSQDPNPLLRSLAIRTMGCIRVEKITEYMCEPLRRCMKDEDPYVRKTAAICVAKLYDLSPELVEDQGFLEQLKDLLSDSNPMVVSNAVAALAEIAETCPDDVFQITASTLHKLLAALNECNEWGQIYILDALTNYLPADAKEAENIIERVTPRLQHANSGVVLSAVKVIMRYLDMINDEDLARSVARKMSAPLVTLLSAEPEIQYVALRNINLIIQKRSGVLSNEIKVFFCKYNDPIYVKMEKIEVMIALVSEKNIDQVLMELKEYASEVDVDFVRKSVRAIGRCAIKLESAAQRCINVLLELIQTKVNYVVQESIIVIKDIFRRYPNQYESIIATLCENLDTLDEPEAKAAMIWIVGEYADRIDNADELLDTFLDNFSDETPQVQLQLLSAVVKLFLKRPTDGQDMVQKVLQFATQECDNPDLRDRAYVYWRLLSSDPDAAKEVVLAEKPVINDDTSMIDRSLLDQLLLNLSTLASVYHKAPEAFVAKVPVRSTMRDDDDEEEEEAVEKTSTASAQPSGGDLLDLGEPSPAAPAAPAVSEGGLDDLLGLGGQSSSATVTESHSSSPSTRKLVLPAEKGKGTAVRMSFARRQGQPFIDFTFENHTSTALGDFAIQFNKNSFGVQPAAPLKVPPIAPGSSSDASLPLAVADHFPPSGGVSPMLQIAVKNSVGIHYFQDEVPFSIFFDDNGAVEKDDFLVLWQSMDDSVEV
mmetsp:Transcript_16780/g.42133  ORF Transcript_16780/g.42133 Transcript_16780/m.42133 type:complete len:803 (-) Transcript_16780:1313-3721(-)